MLDNRQTPDAHGQGTYDVLYLGVVKHSGGRMPLGITYGRFLDNRHTPDAHGQGTYDVLYLSITSAQEFRCRWKSPAEAT